MYSIILAPSLLFEVVVSLPGFAKLSKLLFFVRGQAYSMNEDNDWTQVLKDKVSLVQEQIVKVTLDEEIVVPAGETASVYIYSKNGQLCTKAKEGDSTEADDFMLKAGWITKNEFEDLVEDKWGEFEGEIFYLSG